MAKRRRRLRPTPVRVRAAAAVRTKPVLPDAVALEPPVVLAAAEVPAVDATLRLFFFVEAGEAALSAFPEHVKPRKHESARSQNIVP